MSPEGRFYADLEGWILYLPGGFGGINLENNLRFLQSGEMFMGLYCLIAFEFQESLIVYP